MNIYFSQIYIQVGVTFPFSLAFQKKIGEVFSSKVGLSRYFNVKYGEDWKIIFRISSKRELYDVDIRGPTVFKKDKSVEFSIFLPFEIIQRDKNPNEMALDIIVLSACNVLEEMEFSVEDLRQSKEIIVNDIISNEKMFDNPSL